MKNSDFFSPWRTYLLAHDWSQGCIFSPLSKKLYSFGKPLPTWAWFLVRTQSKSLKEWIGPFWIYSALHAGFQDSVGHEPMLIVYLPPLFILYSYWSLHSQFRMWVLSCRFLSSVPFSGKTKKKSNIPSTKIRKHDLIVTKHNFDFDWIIQKKTFLCITGYFYF